MLRFLLLLLCWTSTLTLKARDQVRDWLPRPGQLVDVWNGDLTQKLDQIRINARLDDPLYTIEGENIPTLHFMLDEERFSIPGVVATGKAELIEERSAIRMLYRGAQSAGTIDKNAQIEITRLDQGSCQLSWKLSVLNRGERVRNQEGALTWICRSEGRRPASRREALNLLPR